MPKDKKHWYDGQFYDKIIAPNQDKMFRIISSIIEEGSSVLDIGCGTGRFTFQMSPKCRRVTGVDLSSKNIRTAASKLDPLLHHNLDFIQGDIAGNDTKLNHKFDYAVITYVIHEVPVNERVKFLCAAKESAEKIIIGDYLVPRPKGFWSYLNEAVEYLAGREHYNNFKIYVEQGGLRGLAESGGFKIMKEIKNKPLTSHIIVIE